MCRVGEFHLKQTSSVVALGAGGVLMAVILSRTFGRVYSAHSAVSGEWLLAADALFAPRI